MIIIIVVVFDYVEKVDDFTELKAPWSAVVNDYYLNFIPYFINQFSSLFTFIAVIFFTSKLAMQTEIVAILSGGVSFRRLMWPYFLGSLIITVVNMALSLWVIPQAQRDIIQFENQYVKSAQRVLYDENAYRQIAPGTFVYVRGYTPRAENVSFFAIEQYEDSELMGKLEASTASFDEESGRWTAPRYVTYKRTEENVYDFELHRNLDTLINLDARELGETKSLVKTMTITELNGYLEQQRGGQGIINVGTHILPSVGYEQQHDKSKYNGFVNRTLQQHEPYNDNTQQNSQVQKYGRHGAFSFSFPKCEWISFQ